MNDGFDPVAHGWTCDDHGEECGPPLQDNELEAAHSSLATDWLSPLDFQTAVKALHRRSSSRVLFNNPRQKVLLDAWTQAVFSQLLVAFYRAHKD